MLNPMAGAWDENLWGHEMPFDVSNVPEFQAHADAQKALIVRQLLSLLDRPTLLRVADTYKKRVDIMTQAFQSDPSGVQAWSAQDVNVPAKNVQAQLNAWSKYNAVTPQHQTSGSPGSSGDGGASSSEMMGEPVQKQILPLDTLVAEPLPIPARPEEDDHDYEERPCTFLLRNLPAEMTHQEALDWVDNMLQLSGLYNFFVLLPCRPGRNCRAALINLLSPENTSRLQIAVSRAPRLQPGLPRPVVMVSKRQGFETNKEHYKKS